ncbi:MAG: YqgE/AlgH family protein [Chloroflexi bacterium]|nr:MAG: YqgE/AlgH family protein [Chloroflexota bacterium]
MRLIMTRMNRWSLLLFACMAGPVLGQPNGILLVAKPGLPDPNFSETVVLVARTDDGATVGVILNRPTVRRLVDIAPSWPGAENLTEPLYAGGPVMRQVVVALYAAEEEPKAKAFRVLPYIYLSMHPANLEPLVAQPSERMRLYAGFSGWAPRQLEVEMASGSWYVLRATEELVFRKDTSGMWSELVERARGSRVARDPATFVAAR